MTPEDYQQPEVEQGMAAPKESFSSPAPARPAPPRYSAYLNLRTVKPGAAGRANPFSLLPEMRRGLQAGEQMGSSGLGSGRLP